MTRNPIVPSQHTFDEDNFDLIEDATEVQIPPPPTPPTQSDSNNSSSIGRLPLSPTTSEPTSLNFNLAEFDLKEKEPIVPPVPPKPARYISSSQIDGLSQKLGQSSMEDSYVSTGNLSETTEGGNDIYASGKKIYNSLKSHMEWGRDKEILIAVMGMTGAGKSTFISKATGKTDLKIGHSLESCTRDISVYETKIDDTIVRFVDTPGFSDTYLSDTEVLEMIADYLAAAYSKGMKLHGIIYLHPISENRMTNPATKNLEMFRKLTGQNNLKNVLLTTSMWDRVTPEEGARRERELKEKFWKILISFQAKTVKYEGTLESAREIAGRFMENKPFYLQLQEEMGKEKKPLRDTAAGQEVMEELARVKEQHQREMEEMKEMMIRTQKERNEVALQAITEHYTKLLSNMERMLADEKRMKDAEVRTLNERISALENRGGGGCHIM